MRARRFAYTMLRFRRQFFAPLLVGVLVSLAACAAGSPLEPAGSGPSASTVGNGGLVVASSSRDRAHPSLVYCKPFDEARRTATIGVMGGTIRVGPHSLWIPPGALLSPKSITAKIVKNDYTNSVQLYPEGLQFIVPATLTLSYANCDREYLLKQLQVVYTSDDLLRILELLPSIKDPVKKTTTGNIRHFSRYAVAY